MDSNAQVSFEYLLTIAISMMLVIVALVLAIQVGYLSETAKIQMINSRNELIQALIK
ncbi:MAG: hypothetical protein ABIA76_04950 [Candidatus Diapherotrites archaeon]